MTETEPQYKWIPVTAADEWWKLPVEEVRCDDYRVLHMWHSGHDTSWPIAVIHEGCTIPKTRWHHPESVHITRRVRVEREPYRYFKSREGCSPLYRVRSTGTDELLCSSGQWLTGSDPWTLDMFIKHGWLECDQDGNPLAATALESAVQTPEFQGQVKDAIEAPKPDRTIPPDLNAENFPAWAVWARHVSWEKGCRENIHVTISGIVVATGRVVWWSDLPGAWQLGDTEGNWYDVPKIGGGE